MGRFDKRHPGAHAYVKILRSDPCVWCGGEGGTIEHVTPRSEVGIRSVHDEGLSRDNWQNLASACYECNQRRDRIPLLQYLIKTNTFSEREG